MQEQDMIVSILVVLGLGIVFLGITLFERLGLKRLENTGDDPSTEQEQAGQETMWQKYLEKSNPKDLKDNVVWRRWLTVYIAVSLITFLGAWIAAHSYNQSRACELGITTPPDRSALRLDSQSRYVPNVLNTGPELTTTCRSKADVNVLWLLFIIGAAFIVGSAYLPKLFRYLYPEFKAQPEKELSGSTAKDKIPEIGEDVPWYRIIDAVLKIKRFDRNGTVITSTGEVKAATEYEAYGFLTVQASSLDESLDGQTFNLPIFHRDDFRLAASVFDDVNIMRTNKTQDREFLAVYSPEKVTRDGRSKSALHAMHFVLAPKGTQEKYYANSLRITEPELELIFGQLKYFGEVKVAVNPNPKV